MLIWTFENLYKTSKQAKHLKLVSDVKTYTAWQNIIIHEWPLVGTFVKTLSLSVLIGRLHVPYLIIYTEHRSLHSFVCLHSLYLYSHYFLSHFHKSIPLSKYIFNFSIFAHFYCVGNIKFETYFDCVLIFSVNISLIENPTVVYLDSLGPVQFLADPSLNLFRSGENCRTGYLTIARSNPSGLGSV